MSHLSQKINSYINLLVVKVVSITFIIMLDVRYYVLFAKLT